MECNRCQDTKVIVLRFEAGDDTRECEVPCDCTRDMRFVDPFEYPGFKDLKDPNRLGL
jgi:hypothetical protein